MWDTPTKPKFSDKYIPPNDSNATNNPNKPPKEPEKKSHQTTSEADEELRRRLEQMSGGGGEAGIEYEDGKPTAMKRSVRENMFRLIWFPPVRLFLT